MTKKRSGTVCPECGTVFDVAKNRKYSIARKYAPFWFFDAVKQFEHHGKVICPQCHSEYKAKEARLFLLFRSPYLLLALCGFLGLVFVLVILSLSGKL